MKIAVPNYRFYEQAFETLQENNCEVGDVIDAFNKRVNKDGVSPTLTTRPEGFKTAVLVIEKNNNETKIIDNKKNLKVIDQSHLKTNNKRLISMLDKIDISKTQAIDIYN